MPRYTLTSPSPLTADPINVLADLSTVKLIFPLLNIAKFPSTFKVSLSKCISSISDTGTLLSNTTIPFPFKEIWNIPSPPAKADDIVFTDTGLTCTPPCAQ